MRLDSHSQVDDVATQHPLAYLRVLDVAGSHAAAVSRILADLGADVLKVEPPGGVAARASYPKLSGVSIPFAVHNVNKRSVVLDPQSDADRRSFADLIADADIVIDSGAPGRAGRYGSPCSELSNQHPHLVSLSMSDFGSEGPRSRWRATDAVLYALSGALSRSGPTTGVPVLPPAGIASATAAVQAVWAVLVAYYHRLRCGTGDHIDFARFDAVVMALDPVFGSHGQVAAAQYGAKRWRGRPRNQDAYPIYPCQDGYVRLCVMAPRQWRGLRAWLGEPEEFRDPKYDVIADRFAAWPRIAILMAELFVGQTMAELVAAGQQSGVPIAAVLDPAQALSCEHFQANGAILHTELAPGVPADVPVGYYSLDGRRMGWRVCAPSVGDSVPQWPHPRPRYRTRRGDPGGRPFDGLRIADLGVIVAGGEASRLFGDLGAEIIKVESKAFPDGLRQTRTGEAMSESFAWTHRNSLSLGLDLRSAAGREIFTDLVARCDVVLANFKPGTLAALGFSYEKLREANPRIVLAESSAFGDSGPWSTRMGYGPLVRATTGVTRLWTASESVGTNEGSRHPFYDATTVFPDHIVGRLTAIGALAGLIRRDRLGVPARIHVSHAEAAVNQLAVSYVALAAGSAADDDPAAHTVCACAGDDEWCVISIRCDRDLHRVAKVLGCDDLSKDLRFATGPDRISHLPELTAVLSDRTREWVAVSLAAALQDAGVPAGQMNRPPDIAEDPQLAYRQVFSDMTHPLVEAVLPAEVGPAPFRHILRAAQRPAPLAGQDTRTICDTVLHMDPVMAERLISDGVLFVDDQSCGHR